MFNELHEALAVKGERHCEARLESGGLLIAIVGFLKKRLDLIQGVALDVLEAVSRRNQSLDDGDVADSSAARAGGANMAIALVIPSNCGATFWIKKL